MVWCHFLLISKIKIRVTSLIGGLIEVGGISEVTEQRSNFDIHQQGKREQSDFNVYEWDSHAGAGGKTGNTD